MRMGIVLAVIGAALLLAASGLFMLRPPTVAAEVLASRYGGPPSQFLKLAGGTVARYQDFPADEGQAGEALVLLHGGGMSLESWAPWIARLRGTRRIIAIDLPGHGLTGATVENDYGAEAMAAFVKAVIDTLGLQGGLVVAGHSMGGHVAWRFALRYPSLVRKLVLVAPGGLATPGGPQARAIKLASLPGGSWVLRLALSRARLAEGLKNVFHDPALVTDEMIDRNWAMSRRAGSMDATIARLQAPSFEPAGIARLGELKMPLLLLWGKDDVVFPISLAPAITQAVPSARLVTYEGCGHFPHEERPDDTTRELRLFLRRDE
jgi:pimeloyl-ACP methyl ester carboxylesterase